MYESETVVAIELTLPAASIEALEAKPDEYQPGTFSLAPTDGTPGGVGEASTPIEVGIRLKGQGLFKDPERQGRLQDQVQRARQRTEVPRPQEANP